MPFGNKIVVLVLLPFLLAVVNGCFMRPGWGNDDRVYHEWHDIIRVYDQIRPKGVDFRQIEGNVLADIKMTLRNNEYNYMSTRVFELANRKQEMEIYGQIMRIQITDQELIVTFPRGAVFYQGSGGDN